MSKEEFNSNVLKVSIKFALTQVSLLLKQNPQLVNQNTVQELLNNLIDARKRMNDLGLYHNIEAGKQNEEKKTLSQDEIRQQARSEIRS